MAEKLIDAYSRIARKLRISITDRCNFACLFCMPEKNKVKWIPKEDILTFEEIERLTRLFVKLGIEKVRITGGEPLMRKDVEKLVAMLAAIPGIKALDMTTNGWFLAEKAYKLREAGLRGVTVSLHSLRRDRFAKISGIDALDRVVQGIDKAIEAGLAPVKINSVAIAGYNDDEMIELVDFARKRNISIRFIEFMPLDGLGVWSQDKMIKGEEIIRIVSAKYRLIPKGREAGDTATLYDFEDRIGEIGVITPMSNPFCDTCDRIRLTADGKLLTCLFDTRYNDLKSFMRKGLSDSELESYIKKYVYMKPPGIAYMPWIKTGWEKPRAMHAIGG
ncbi:MAG: GTP 3',8-cyclase MoaA [Nitrososphaerota archaeon]